MSILDDITGTSLVPVSVRCTDTSLIVTLQGGQSITNALTKYPRLLHASPEEQANVELSPFGIHWPDIDEDLSINGLIKGNAAPDALSVPANHTNPSSDARI